MERLNRIKAVLADREMTQTELAKEIGRNRNTVTRICNNKSQPSLEDLYRIADVLKVDVCELLIRSNERAGS